MSRVISLLIASLVVAGCSASSSTPDGGVATVDSARADDTAMAVSPDGGRDGATVPPAGSMASPDAGGAIDAGVPLAKADPVRVKACADQARLFCAKLEQCYPGALRQDYASLADCQARKPVECTGEPAIPGSTITAAMLDACNAAQAALSCEDYFNNAPVPACQFTGSRPAGATCFGNEQCQTGHCSISGLCGACTAFLVAGNACGNGGTCGPGLFCNGRVCITLGAAGAACDATQLFCGYGLYCAAGKCTAQGAMVGAACDPLSQDASSCSDAMNLICDPATSKCVAQTYTAKGQPCSRTSPICEGGTGCLITVMGGSMGMCVPLQQPGDQCDRNRPCQAPYRCYAAAANAPSGVCVLGDVPDPAICQ